MNNDSSQNFLPETSQELKKKEGLPEAIKKIVGLIYKKPTSMR